MATMTLRLDDGEEKLLDENMQWLHENTKTKTIIRMLKTYKTQYERLNEYIERTRKAEYELKKLKELLRERALIEKQLREIID